MSGRARVERKRGVFHFVATVTVLSLLTGSLGSAGAAYPRPGRAWMASLGHDDRPSEGSIPHEISLSGNGRVLAFSSEDDLAPTDRNPLGADLYARNFRSETTEHISVDSDGEGGVGGCVTPNASDPSNPIIVDAYAVEPDVSRSGRFIAYSSCLTTLVPGDTNNARDVFVRDVKLGRTILVSRTPEGEVGNASSDLPSISGDGRLVVFRSVSSDLLDGDTNGKSDTFLHDLKTGETTRISLDSEGNQATEDSSCGAIDESGRYVAFTSFAALVPDDPPLRNPAAASDVYVRDLDTDELEIVSLRAIERPSAVLDGAGPSTGCTKAISRGGRYVTYGSGAAGHVPNDGKIQDGDIYMFDRATDRTVRVSVTSSGETKQYRGE